MAALPYMQLYVSDYLSDTLYLDVVESGAYLHLLMNYWQTGKPLPDCDKKLARISKCTDEQWLNVRSAVVEYFDIIDGVLYHGRVEADLEKVKATSVKNSINGKKSAAARALKSKGLEDRSTVVETVVDDSLNHTDTDTDTDKRVGTKRFVKPSVKELSEFLNNPDMANDFFDYNESRGWKIGKSNQMMKDWKAAARRWARKQKEWDKDKKPQGSKSPHISQLMAEGKL